MATLPTIAALTGDSVTQAQFKTELGNLRTFLYDLLGDAGTEAAALSALGALLNAVSAKTSAYTVGTSDRGVLIDATSGTWTLSLTAAATLGAGFAFAVRNSGTGTITIDPNGTEQIDGATTVTLSEGQSAFIICTGSAFRTVGRTQGQTPSVWTYDTPGTDNFTIPAAGTMTLIECWGGGGSGARNPFGCGGGGGGDYVCRVVPKAHLGSPGSTVGYTVGAGGASKTSDGAGNAGNNTSFGSHVLAYGGRGGSFEGSSASGGIGYAGTTGGTGGAAAAAGQSAIWGGAGGGGTGGAGGLSVYGGNGGAGGGANGTAGSQPGGGGGGGTSASGAGGTGRIRITVW